MMSLEETLMSRGWTVQSCLWASFAMTEDAWACCVLDSCLFGGGWAGRAGAGERAESEVRLDAMADESGIRRRTSLLRECKRFIHALYWRLRYTLRAGSSESNCCSA